MFENRYVLLRRNWLYFTPHFKTLLFLIGIPINFAYIHQQMSTCYHQGVICFEFCFSKQRTLELDSSASYMVK